MKKQDLSSVTYQELMNSHFIHHPSSNKLLYTLFHPIVVILVCFGGVVLLGITTGIDRPFYLFLGAICTLLPARFMMSVSAMCGHGVGIVKRPKFSLFGLGKLHTIIMSALIVVMVLLNAVAFIVVMPEKGFGGQQIIAVSLLFSLLMTLGFWRFRMYYDTWYGSEYLARKAFEDKGQSKAQIDENIQILRKKGILPWHTPS